MHGVTLGKELMGRLAMDQDCQEHYHGTTNYTVMQTCLKTNDKRKTPISFSTMNLELRLR